MQWFRHSTTARNDEDLVALTHKYGLAAEAVWWRVVEFCSATEGPLAVPDGDYDLAGRVLGLDPRWKVKLALWLDHMASLSLLRRSARQGVIYYVPAQIDRYLGPRSDRPDNVRDRVRKHRDRKRLGGVTPVTGETVTPPEGNALETETEREIDLPISPQGELPKIPRTEVRKVACPLCRAEPGTKCIGARNQRRESNHMERVLAADRAVSDVSVRERERIDGCVNCGGSGFIEVVGGDVAYCPACRKAVAK